MSKWPAQENIESNHKCVKDISADIIKLRHLVSAKKQDLKVKVLLYQYENKKYVTLMFKNKRCIIM